MNKKIKSVAVYCGHQPGNRPEYMHTAKKIGELLAKNDMTLVYGGSNAGLMGAVASSALENGGHILGISTPEVVALQEPALDGIDVEIVDGLAARKQKMFDLADAFVILPGGIGTLDEMTDILTKQQIRESCKPIYIMNVAHYWEQLDRFMIVMREEGFTPGVANYNVHVMTSPEELIEKLINSDDFFPTCQAL